MMVRLGSHSGVRGSGGSDNVAEVPGQWSQTTAQGNCKSRETTARLCMSNLTVDGSGSKEIYFNHLLVAAKFAAWIARQAMGMQECSSYPSTRLAP